MLTHDTLPGSINSLKIHTTRASEKWSHAAQQNKVKQTC